MPATFAAYANGRLTLPILVALLVHVVIIFGIRFDIHRASSRTTTLDVTLSAFKSKTHQDADLIAQEDQQGSGQAKQSKPLTTDVDADFHVNRINPVSVNERIASAPKTPTLSILSTPKSHRLTASDNAPNNALPMLDNAKESHVELSAKLASLEARLAALRQTQAKAPQNKSLVMAATAKATEALYVNRWLQTIERLSNQHYPQSAQDCSNNCQLKMKVSVNADGSLHDIALLSSSGRPLLDATALRLVEDAAPFTPFDKTLREHTQRIEIVRTWVFRSDGYLTELRQKQPSTSHAISPSTP